MALHRLRQRKQLLVLAVLCSALTALLPVRSEPEAQASAAKPVDLGTGNFDTTLQALPASYYVLTEFYAQ